MLLESSIGQVEVAAYFAAINALAFAAFAWDKPCARLGSWRVRERTLIWLALIGGSVGAFAGQQVMRHKTSKQPFRAQLSAVIGFQTLVIAGLILFAGIGLRAGRDALSQEPRVLTILPGFAPASAGPSRHRRSEPAG